MAKRGGFPGGGMPGNMANLMKQAQKMQRQMEEQAKELETKQFTATAGGGAVKVTVSGKREVLGESFRKKWWIRKISRCFRIWWWQPSMKHFAR